MGGMSEIKEALPPTGKSEFPRLFVQENLLQFEEEENIMQEYFNHIFETSRLQQPNNWEEAAQLYSVLMGIANETGDGT
jgi:hypothetical protein